MENQEAREELFISVDEVVKNCDQVQEKHWVTLLLRVRKERFKFCNEKEETSGKLWKDGWHAKNKQEIF